MQNREASLEKDPHLRRNDSLAQTSYNSSYNKWTETMKGEPSFSEHMRRVEAQKPGSQNAFSKPTVKTPSIQNKQNAVTQTTSFGQSSSKTVTNNAIKVASNTQAKSSGGIGQNTSAVHGQSTSRSR